MSISGDGTTVKWSISIILHVSYHMCLSLYICVYQYIYVYIIIPLHVYLLTCSVNSKDYVKL